MARKFPHSVEGGNSGSVASLDEDVGTTQATTTLMSSNLPPDFFFPSIFCQAGRSCPCKKTPQATYQHCTTSIHLCDSISLPACLTFEMDSRQYGDMNSGSAACLAARTASAVAAVHTQWQTLEEVIHFIFCMGWGGICCQSHMPRQGVITRQQSWPLSTAHLFAADPRLSARQRPSPLTLCPHQTHCRRAHRRQQSQSHPPPQGGMRPAGRQAGRQAKEDRGRERVARSAPCQADELVSNGHWSLNGNFALSWAPALYQNLEQPWGPDIRGTAPNGRDIFTSVDFTTLGRQWRPPTSFVNPPHQKAR